jgi:hypothetical protein
MGPIGRNFGHVKIPLGIDLENVYICRVKKQYTVTTSMWRASSYLLMNRTNPSKVATPSNSTSSNASNLMSSE